MKINKEKIKTMVISNQKITLDGQELEQFGENM